MKPKAIPILVGAAQYTQRKDDPGLLDPLGLMIKAGRQSLADTGTNGLKALIDTVCVVNSFSRDDEQAPALLSLVLGINAQHNIYSAIGGNTPQMLVNHFSRDIAAGRRKGVLIAGAEAIYTMYKASRDNLKLDWTDNPTFGQIKESNLPANFDTLLHMGCHREKSLLEAQGDRYDEPNNSVEMAYDLFMPQYMYPFFETALRYAAGRTPSEHLDYMGRCYERLSRVASDNPYAWSRQRLDSKDIAVATSRNRYVIYPYTLRMVANINVDQAAALVMTNEQDAERLGIERHRWVYPLGGAELNNIWHVSQRPCLHDSPAIMEAARLSLQQAGLFLHDIDIFDLYSCFPSAIEIARQAVGIPDGDPRDLTLTGGLAYFGGPGNNYTLHAIAATVELIRRDRRLKAMITANGWYNSKHAIGIYGATPPDNPWENRDDTSIQKAITAAALPEPVEQADGLLTVEAVSTRYDVEGKPERATVIGRLPDGKRALADIQADSRELAKMMKIELVGKTGVVRYDPIMGRNRLRIESALYEAD
jgi:acetyl-CoA C-acetyltransferase